MMDIENRNINNKPWGRDDDRSRHNDYKNSYKVTKKCNRCEMIFSEWTSKNCLAMVKLYKNCNNLSGIAEEFEASEKE